MKREEVLRELKKRRKREISYSSGRVLCSMCTTPLEISKRAYSLFFDTNLGDPRLFRETAEIEREALELIGELVSLREPHGNIVSGGTEANITAVYVSREITKKRKILIPKSAHFSFEKAKNMLNMERVDVKLDENYTMNTDDLSEKISKDFALVVAVAGSTELGTIDNIPRVAEICEDYGIRLHVDAAFGGFVIPFLDKKHLFDFSIEQVSSMTIDPHKMACSQIPAGCILFREDDEKYISVKTPYLLCESQNTILGTRPGASAASVWAILKYLGKDGLRKIVKRCMRNTEIFVRFLKKSDLFELVTEPQMNIVGFRAKRGFKRWITERGWIFSEIKELNALRAVFMPHIKRKDVYALIEDMKIYGEMNG